jgi:hypothetical protein
MHRRPGGARIILICSVCTTFNEFGARRGVLTLHDVQVHLMFNASWPPKPFDRRSPATAGQGWLAKEGNASTISIDFGWNFLSF